jgi:threonylcarbamoyladenosine tRNA methylthiotransferase MtaB
MKRRWGVKRFLDRCELAKAELDEPALTTDVIVGFPGETEEDFAATCDAARAAGFSKIHIFPFSPRRGTPAAEMPNQVSPEVKHDRRRRLESLERELRGAYFRRLVGRRLRVMAESYEHHSSSAGHLVGTSCRYAPVVFPAELARPGELIDVVACRATHECIEATSCR